MKKKDNLQIFFLIIISLFFVRDNNAQVIQIYTATSQQPIERSFKISDPQNNEKLYFIVSPPDSYTAEKIYRYNHALNNFEVPHNGFVSASCSGSPISCSGFEDLQISALDTNIMLKAFQAAWWEPAGYIQIFENGNVRDLFESGFGFNYGGMAIDPVNDQNMYVVWKYSSFDSTNTFYKTTDRGLTWSGNSSINFGQVMYGAQLKVNPFNNSMLIYPVINNILRSTNSGLNFTVLSSNTGTVSEIVFDRVDHIIYFVTNQGLFIADENAGNFHQISNKIFNTVLIDPEDNDILFAGDHSGLWRSADQGITWTLYSNLFEPTRNVKTIIHNPSMGDTIIVTTARGVYKVYGDSILTGINAAQNNHVNDFILHQNFPNPFNPVTIINYDVNTSSYVRIRIFDISGNEISALVNSRQQPGTYEVEFKGNELASGIYFYSLEADGVILSTKKMTLLK